MPQNTNLNASPYFDDFDDQKNYQRVLFKPGLPIQSRELTTLQSILQNQVEKFGRHFFKEGSVVIPGQIAYDDDYSCVQIDDTHLGLPVSLYLDALKGKLIKGETSGVTAKIEYCITNRESERGNYTLYIKYQSSSDQDFSRSTFVDGEDLLVQEDVNYTLSSIRAGTSFATTIISQSTQVGSAVKIANGVYFIRGFFVEVLDQTVILDQYGNEPSYRVGLLVNEEVVTASSSNEDLYDNARGFSNFAAPGADRFKISTTLVKKSLTDFNDENFIELLRVEEGVVSKFVKTTDYNLIRDELARRTYDESGDYYIKPFSVSVKENLNDRTGNDGAYYSNQVTQQGNKPSESLISLSVGPGKAYVRGYEVETLNTTTIDVPKPRGTEKLFNESIPFSLGKQIELNNVYGSSYIGIGTDTYVNLHKDRTATPGTASGIQIGVARLYDLKLKNAQYVDASTIFEASLYDIQTFTYIEINTHMLIPTPALIEGQSSGATGYIYETVNDVRQVKLYQVNGQFQEGEEIHVNGEPVSRSITRVEDYSIEDVRQISGAGSVAFTADTRMNKGTLIAPLGSQFSLTAAVSGVSTATCAALEFSTNIGIRTGDIIRYSVSGNSVPTFHSIKEIDVTNKKIVLEATADVTNVNAGSLPTSQITANDFFKVSTEVLNPNKSFLYSELTKPNVASVDLTGSDVIFRKTYNVSVASGSYSATLESDASLTLEPFDEEDYNLTFHSTGVVEPLTNQKLTVSGRTITLSGLSVSSGNATLTVTWKKVNVRAKNKVFKRASINTVNLSAKNSSGIGVTTIEDGLTYSTVYGTRVQDRRLSIGVPDVSNVIAVLESSSVSDPQFPVLVLSNLNTNILNALRGEKMVGQTSGAAAVFVDSNGSNEVDFVYRNENAFEIGEEVVFEESNVTATVLSFVPGDRDIKDNFEFDAGQREDYIDFSSLVRKPGAEAPTRRISIVYNHFVIEQSDPGDFVAINSYDADLYATEVPLIEGEQPASDVLDFRPRVTTVAANRSPFEFLSRTFDQYTSSSSLVLAKDKSTNVSYDYYLGRIDKLYVSKDGIFSLSVGVPAIEPKIPNTIENALEVATVYLPPYVYNANQVELKLARHKRYRMKDISIIEDRLKNVEYYTALSLLETETANLALKDAQTNLDRFKSGFFVDNFKSTTGGDVTNSQYKASVDPVDGRLRPQHYTTSIDLLLGSEAIVGAATSSSPASDYRFVTDLGDRNVKRVGDVVCLNYSDKTFLENKFATRIENVNPFAVVNWIGQIELNPSTDTWIETRRSSATYDVEGSFNAAMGITGADSNTGMSPIDWGSWETTWTGRSVSNGPTVLRQNRSTVTSRNTRRTSGFVPGRGIRLTTTTTRRVRRTRIREQTVTTTTNQTRQGIQFRVGERFDTTTLGDRVVSTEVIATMRSRNIEFVCRRLKPNTRLYAFFDNIDMNKYIVPKLVEIEMVSGTFGAGETVVGTVTNGNASCRFRLAQTNHKYGTYDSPTQTYVNNPYSPSSSIPSTYSSTSTLLNIDTASLELQSASGFFGHLAKGMKIVGQSSGAVATVKDVRLITDKAGVLIGSLFLPDPTVPSAPSFNTGSKTFTLTSSSTNQTISGFTDSSAEGTFTSSGTLQNVEEATLRIRNADVQRIPRSQDRTLTSSDTRLVADVSFRNRTTRQSRWVDPLAQSFEVPDINGVFLTKCEVYFRSKDTNSLPVTLQVRTLQTGLPTQEILPFGEVILDPSEVVLSEDGSLPTTFTFPSPVYCEGSGEYAIVLLSASNEYTVFISRMGEEDISTVNQPDSEKIIVAQQPLLGSLFKSQNGATWDPSQLEDLKFTLYRAEFSSDVGKFKLYNPDLDIGNRQIAKLRTNPLDMVSKNIIVGLGKSLTASEQLNLSAGVTILQENNPNFSANLSKVLGAVGVGSVLTLTNIGAGFTAGATTYSNVPLISRTGRGAGAKANISINGGVAVAATVSIGGTGYAAGDTLTVDFANTGGFGKNLLLTIPNEVGVISAFNTLLIDQVQGGPKIDASSAVVYVGGGGSSILNGTPITYLQDITDGIHARVRHNNHGMYSERDTVKLSGFEPDVKPEKITASYNSTSTEALPVSSVGIFTAFENLPVDTSNPGYVTIGKEIIRYSGVSTSAGTLTGITRAIDDTISGDYAINSQIEKYELNGVSLRRINATHSFADSNLSKYGIDVDHYWINVGMSSRGVDRTTGNPSGFPELFWRETKSGGSYVTELPMVGNLYGPQATQNIPFNILRPNIGTLQPEATNIEATVRTFTGNSPDGNLTAYVDQGYEAVSLNSNNVFSSPRIIASKENELNRLQDFPGRKSFTMEMALSSNDPKVSPMIDLDRINVVTTMDRINSKITDYSSDLRVNSLDQDPSAAIYLSKVVRLEKAADGLRVLFDAYRHASNDIRVLYRVFRVDAPADYQLFELFPGYDNLDSTGRVIDTAKNSGRSDRNVLASNTEDDYREYEFNAQNLPQFNGFQIKIVMTGTNYAYVPKIRDLRAIASI